MELYTLSVERDVTKASGVDRIEFPGGGHVFQVSGSDVSPTLREASSGVWSIAMTTKRISNYYELTDFDIFSSCCLETNSLSGVTSSERMREVFG